jgi:hypothetical protein
VDGVIAYGIDRHVVLAQNLTTVAGRCSVKNVFGNAGNTVVYAEANTGDFSGVSIKDVIGNGVTSLCLVQALAGRTIKGVTVEGCKSSTALAGRGIRILATGASAVIEDVAIAHNRLEASGTGSNTEIIFLFGSSGGVINYVSLSGNRTYQGSYGLRAIATDYVTTDGTNIFLAAGTSNRTVAGSNNRLRNDIGTPSAAEVVQAVTIASGVVTILNSGQTKVLTVDTESAGATDDLDTVSGGIAGDIIVLKAANAARDVVAKDGTGNMRLAGDFTLDNTDDAITLLYDGTIWRELSRSDNAA